MKSKELKVELQKFILRYMFKSYSTNSYGFMFK